MSRFNQILSLLLVLLLTVLSFASCGGTAQGGEESQAPDSGELSATDAPETEEPTTEEPATEAPAEPVTVSFDGLEITLPAGWYMTEANDGNPMAVSATYPEPGDTLVFGFAEDVPYYYTEENLIPALESILGGEGSLTDFRMETDDWQGVKRITLFYNVPAQGAHQVNTNYFLPDGTSLNITYTGFSGEFDEAIGESLKTLVLPAQAEPGTNLYTLEDVQMTLPDGWTVQTNDNGVQIAVSPYYPTVPDNISLSYGAGSPDGFTEAVWKQYLESMFGEGSVEDLRMVEDTWQGARRITFSYFLNTYNIRQTVANYFFNGHLLCLTLTSTTGFVDGEMEAVLNSVVLPESSEPTESSEPIVITYEGAQITLPAGWVAMDINGASGAALPTYPQPADSIVFSYGPDDMSSYTEDVFVPFLESVYGEGAVSDFNREEDTWQGVPRLVVSYRLTNYGITQFAYMYKLGNNVLSFILTCVGDANVEAMRTAVSTVVLPVE